MPFFHVTIASLFVGDVITTERHGDSYRAVQSGFTFTSIDFFISFLWELSLESARIAGFPDKPSRLNSVFASETVEAAADFKRRFRTPDATILEVEPVEALPKIHRAELDLISANVPDGPWIDSRASIATRYWRDASQGPAEVLIGCPVRVVRVL